MVISIPIVFAAGVVAFFVLLPPELITLVNFVAYASSLSTIVMVLVYVFTTSLQLRAMQGQLNEMQYSRDVQAQPLLYFDKLKMGITAPRLGLDPGTKKVDFSCSVHFDFNVSNIGNCPAVAIDFVPNLARVMPRDDTITTLVKYIFNQRIECISLKKEDLQNISLIFLDDEHKFIESVLGEYVVLHLVIVFKNILGMPFKEEVAFRVLVHEPKLREILQSWIKRIRTYEIDFTKDVSESEKLAELDRYEELRKKFKQIMVKLKAQLGDVEEEVEIPTDIRIGSFSISPISQSEYDRIIAEKKEAMSSYFSY